MKIKTVISCLLAVFTVGVIASIDWRQGRSEEQRLRSMEARLDSLTHSLDSLSYRVDRQAVVLDATSPVAPWRPPEALVQDIQDSLRTLAERHAAKHATVRFIMVQGDTVLGTWAEMQSRVWDIRQAEPIK